MFLSYVLLAMMTLGVCLSARKIGHALKVLDVPCRKGRKTHRRVTPLVGGVAIMAPFIVLLGVETALFQAPLYFGLLILSVIFLGMGFLDDRGHLSPVLRLAVATIACTSVVFLVPELRLDRLEFTFGSFGPLPDPIGGAFAVLCLVALQNAVNMADGKNGLVIGLSLIWVAALAVFAPPQLTPILIVLAAGLGITLVFNLRGKLFLGDAGSYALSIVIGTLTVYSYNAHAAAPDLSTLTAGGVVLWFLVPVLDCGRLIVSRLLQGSSPFSADRNHLHHLLTQKMGSKQALTCYFSLVGVPIAISVVARDMTPVLLFATTVVYCGSIWALSPRTKRQPASILPFPAKVLTASVSRPVSASVGAVFIRRRTEADVMLRNSSAEALPAQRGAEAGQVPLSNVGY